MKSFDFLASLRSFSSLDKIMPMIIEEIPIDKIETPALDTVLGDLTLSNKTLAVIVNM